MSTQRQVPGGPYVNETQTKERQIPGAQFVNETVAAAAAASSPLTRSALLTNGNLISGRLVA